MTSLLLLLLYASVLVPVYEWIKIEDLCFLDTAVCNQQLRNMFLDMLTFCYSTEEVIEGSTVFVWMMLRGVRVRKLSVVSWTPVVDVLVESKFLSQLTAELDQLSLHLRCIQKNIKHITLHLPHPFDVSQLKYVGSAITELILWTVSEMTSSKMCTIAACCPNLRKVSAGSRSFILPFVDACQLDEINGCHLGSLVKREKYERTYCCDLQRAYEVDETAVCLGEGKHYHLTALTDCGGGITLEDADLLIPLMPHLNRLFLHGKQSMTITSAAVEKCHRLTELTVRKVYSNELKLLLQRSPLLRRFHVMDNNSINVDVLIDTISESCPLLEECSLIEFVIESESAMSKLFRKCQFLRDFSARRWPVDSVLPFAVNFDFLVLVHFLCARKSARGLRKLEIPHQITKKALCSLFLQNPGVLSVELTGWFGESSVIKALVQSCPLLTSLAINCENRKSTALEPLGCLLHLNSLNVCYSVGFTVKSVSAMLRNKSSTLLTLSFIECDFSGDISKMIGRLCPALTSLDLNGNWKIKNADIMYLLNSCTKLEVLSLQSCSHVTSKVLSSIKSPPMRHLNVRGTGIGKTGMMRYKSVEGFEYCI